MEMRYYVRTGLGLAALAGFILAGWVVPPSPDPAVLPRNLRPFYSEIEMALTFIWPLLPVYLANAFFLSLFSRPSVRRIWAPALILTLAMTATVLPYTYYVFISLLILILRVGKEISTWPALSILILATAGYLAAFGFGWYRAVRAESWRGLITAPARIRLLGLVLVNVAVLATGLGLGSYRIAAVAAIAFGGFVYLFPLDFAWRWALRLRPWSECLSGSSRWQRIFLFSASAVYAFVLTFGSIAYYFDKSSI